MKYHTLFFLKIRENVQKLSSAAPVIGALRVNTLTKKNKTMTSTTHNMYSASQGVSVVACNI